MPKNSNSFNVLALVLILLGLILTLDNFNIINGAFNLWPLLTLIIGIGFCLLFHKNRNKDLVLLGLGSFITMISLFFFYLNFTTWTKLSYLWPVFITTLGLSFLPPYSFSKNNIVISLGILLMAIGLSFIFIFSIDTSLWPLSLVLTGVSFLIISIFSTKKRKK